MKREVFILVFLMFLIPQALAVKVDTKPNLQPGETFLAEIEGNFLSPVTPDNIYFYSDRVQIPLTSDIARINDKYYIYALLPVIERNYTLLLKDLHYFENSQEKTESIETNFTVSGNITDFSVFPGFIITKGNFSVILESKNNARDITAQILDKSNQVHVPAGESRKVSFSFQLVNFTFTSMSISSPDTTYSIPVAILATISNTTVSTNTSNVSQSEQFDFTYSLYNFSVYENKETKTEVYIKNVGDTDITNITLDLTSNLGSIISFTPKKLDIEAGESKKIELTILTDSIGTLLGKIRASTDNLSITSDLIVNSYSEDTLIPIPIDDDIKPCLYYGGSFCNTDQNCNGEVKDSSDGDGKLCCLGSCEKKTSYTGPVVGVVLLIALFVGLFFLYKKSKTKKPDSSQIINQKSKDFEKRFTAPEVRNNLARS